MHTMYARYLLGFKKAQKALIITGNSSTKFPLCEISLSVSTLCSLCAVDDDMCEDMEEGVEKEFYTFKLHARKSTITLSARSAEDVSEWTAALQDVIDSSPTIQTITERVILEIIVSTSIFQ